MRHQQRTKHAAHGTHEALTRRLLRDIAEGKALGDTTTLADPGMIAKLKGAVWKGAVWRGAGLK